METINIMQAAQQAGVSDKTIRRAIHAGKLRANFPKPNQAQITVEDLNVYLSGQSKIASSTQTGHESRQIEERVSELEQRVADLERQLQSLREQQKKRAIRRTGLLPETLVSLYHFADQHNVSKTDVQRTLNMHLQPTVEGAWTLPDGEQIIHALDAKGMAAFHQIHNSLPLFTKCKNCPHTV